MEQEAIRLICKRGKELFVTRPLLIQSSRYFAALLSKGSSWLESSVGTIELDSWRRDDLATILQSLKTKETEAIFENVDYYFAAINYFSIYPLMEQCTEFKIKNITDDSVIADLEFAERFFVVALRDKCIEYLLRRLPDVLRGSRTSRRRMSAELLEKLLRHENLSVRNEDEVLSLIDAWCSWGKRKSERSKLLQYVRFAHLTKNAFEKCRQDAQCLEVPQFRRLLETPRWSDLNEEFLSGRKTSRVHYHIIGLLNTIYDTERKKLLEYDKFANRAVLHCSEAGTLSTVHGRIEKPHSRTITRYSPSVRFGTASYACSPPAYPVFLSTGEPVEILSELTYYPDFRNLEVSGKIQLKDYFYIVAEPAYFKNYLFIAHMPFRNEPILQHGEHILEPEACDYLEVHRFHGGEASFATFRINVERDSRLLICQCLRLKINCLFVDDQWMILCLPNQDVLLVLQAPHPIGQTIEFPEQCLLMKNSHRHRTQIYSDMVVIGNVAYVVLTFDFYDQIEPQSGEHPFIHGKTPAGSITAYDLTEGKWLPGHFVNLTTYFAEKKTFGSFTGERLRMFLKVVQDELFIILISNRVEPRQSGFPLASIDYVYRVERSDDRLWLSPVSDSAATSINKWLDRDKYTLFTWVGKPDYVDVYPCEYASMLHLKANQEEDPDEYNKLRRFIW